MTINYTLDRGFCSCSPLKEGNKSICPDIYGSLDISKGEIGQALQLQYDLGETQVLGDTPDCWVQVKCEFEPELNLSAYDHMRISWTGASGSSNSLQVGMVSGGKNFFTPLYHHATRRFGQVI